MKGREITGEELDRLLALDEPAAADLRALAAYLVYAATRDVPPEELMRRLNPVQRFLETHERLLPVRAPSGWRGTTCLALPAKTFWVWPDRDRLLARLFNNGLRPEQDLPTFLRFSGEAGGRRYHDIGKWLTRVCERARHWVGQQGHDALYAGKNPRTTDYVDLLFSFGLARLGEADASRRLLQRASTNLPPRTTLTSCCWPVFAIASNRPWPAGRTPGRANRTARIPRDDLEGAKRTPRLPEPRTSLHGRPHAGGFAHPRTGSAN